MALGGIALLGGSIASGGYLGFDGLAVTRTLLDGKMHH